MGNAATRAKDPTITQPRGDIRLPLKTLPTSHHLRPQPPPLETVKYSQPSLAVTNEPIVPDLNIKKSIDQETSAYSIWKQNYYGYRVQKEDLSKYDSRIQSNADNRQRELEERRRQVRLQRIEAEAAVITNKEYPKPILSVESCINFTSRYLSFKKHDKKYFTPKPERPELTPEMIMRIEHASKPNPPTEVLVQIDGVDITRRDIRTLTGLNWLNDEIINAYLSLIVMRGKEPKRRKVYAFNTFFYPKVRESGYNSVKRWTRKVDIFSHDFILVPVHLGNHWCMAVINFMDRTISYYDSLGGGTNGCCDTLLEYLRYESNDKKKQDFDDENWKLINCYNELGIPQQQNGSDCGVFACIYAEYLTREAKLKFGQQHMSYFRQKMIYELLTKKILD